MVHNLSIVTKRENDFTIFKFDVRVILVKGATSPEAVLPKLGDNLTFGDSITSPYQVVTGNSFTNVVKSEANTDIPNSCIQVNTSAAANYKISNSGFWFASTSNLLDTTIASISKDTCDA